MSLFGGKLEPLGGNLDVGRDTLSLRIHRRKIDLRICVTQFGEAPNFAERRRFGLCWKFFNPTEGLLGDIQSLCRRLFEPPGGLGWILGNAAAPIIHQAEFKLSFCVTLLSGFAELSEGGWSDPLKVVQIC